MGESKRLRWLPKLTDIPKEAKLTIERPLIGSNRLRVMVNGEEYDPTGLFDKQGKTNSQRVLKDCS